MLVQSQKLVGEFYNEIVIAGKSVYTNNLDESHKQNYYKHF